MKNIIWYEKYRPRRLSSLVLDEGTRQTLKGYIKKKQIPHLLFYGPAGSGKTTLSMIFLKEVAAGKLILNASSDDRGIATIKYKVKQFASAHRGGQGKLNIVLLDEADGLTFDAQLALKNTIETYHKNCRFILTCNQIDRIDNAILSRCMLFKFDTFPKDKLNLFLGKILKKERIKHRTKDIREIVKMYYPDIRSTINNLQLYSTGGRLSIPDVSGDLYLFQEYLSAGKLFEIRKIFSGKMDFVYIFKYLFDCFILEHMDESIRAEAAIVVAEYLWKDRTVVDKEINCVACCIELMNLMEVEIVFG